MLKLYDLEDNELNPDSIQYQRNKGAIQIRRKEREQTFMKKRMKLDIPYPQTDHDRTSTPQSGHAATSGNQVDILNRQGGNINGLSSENGAQNQQKYLKVIADPRYREEIQEIAKVTFTLEMLDQLIYYLQQEEPLQIMYGAMGLRRILSLPGGPTPIQQVIDTGIVPYLLNLINLREYPQIQMEVIWSLTNIAAGTNDQSLTIIQHGGVPLLVQAMKNTDNVAVVEQILWALGNLAADSCSFRDMIINDGGIEAILNMLMVIQKEEKLINETCWCLANMCRGMPLPDYNRIKQALPVLCIMVSIGSILDNSTLSDCLWAISYHCDGMKNRADSVLESNILQKLIPMLIETVDYNILLPGIRIVGQISTGPTKCVDTLLKEHNTLQLLERCLKINKKMVRREACWILSNLTAGSLEHILMILQRQSLIKRLIQMFEDDSLDIRKEICYVFGNMTYQGRQIDIHRILISMGVIELFVQMLENSEEEYLIEVLETLEHCLRLGEDRKQNKKDEVNLVVEEIHRCGGGKVLERLQYTDDEAIYRKLLNILTTYFELWDPMEERDGRKRMEEYSQNP